MVDQDQPTSITLPISAGARVASTVELLEHILLYLAAHQIENEAFIAKIGVRTTLLAQRVSRAFRNTVIGSTGLQKALFFAPPAEDVKYSDRKLNPLLCTSLRINQRETFKPATSLSGMFEKTVYVTLYQETCYAVIYDASARGVESWRKMYLCQAPYFTENVAVAVWRDRGRGWRYVRTSTQRENPTLGQLVDLAFPGN